MQEPNEPVRTNDVTFWLRRATDGDPAAREKAYALVEQRLREIVRSQMLTNDAINMTLTEIVDDAFLKLMNLQDIRWDDRLHFLRFACTIIKHLLVDRARNRQRQKRNSGQNPEPLDTVLEPIQPGTPEQFIALTEALERLNADYPDLAVVVDLRYFGGWTLEEIANQILNVPVITVKRRWSQARTLLHAWLTAEV